MWPQTKHYVARVAWKYLFTSFWVRKGYLSISLSQKQSIHVSLIMMMIFCAVNCSFNRGRAKKKSNFFPTVARKSSSQPCCEPGLSSSAGPPPLSLSHWLQFDLGRPPLLLLWQVYFNNAGGTGCVGIAGGELWDCGDVGRVCVVEGMCPSIYSYSLQFLRKERGPSFVDSRQPPPPKLQFLFTHDTSHPSLILTYYPSTAPLSLYLSQRVLTPFFPFLNPSMSSHPRSPNWQN